MRKTALALVSATAVTIGALTPVANSASVNVEGGTCTFRFNDTEKKFSYLPFFEDMTPEKAKEYVTQYSHELERDKKGLKTLRQDFDNGVYASPISPDTESLTYDDKKALANAENARFKADVKVVQDAMAIRTGLLPALRACAENRSFDETKPNSDDLAKIEADQKLLQEATSSAKLDNLRKPEDIKIPERTKVPTTTLTPDKPSKPDNSKEPSALSTEDGELNGAGIGVVVAGIIAVLIAVAAAAFPQLQAMLG